jgi:hypothetical protein
MSQIKELSPGFTIASIMLKSILFGVIAGTGFTLTLAGFVILLTMIS